MNSKSVLSKIMTLLSLENEVYFTDAKEAKGNILQSPTFEFIFNKVCFLLLY